MKRNYNIKNNNVNYETNLRSRQQAEILQREIEENPHSKFRVFFVPGDSRNAWRKFYGNNNFVKLGYSCGSRGNNNYHSTWVERLT